MKNEKNTNLWKKKTYLSQRIKNEWIRCLVMGTCEEGKEVTIWCKQVNESKKKSKKLVTNYSKQKWKKSTSVKKY